MNTLTSAFASVNLQRFPLRNNETLQAWDAADELLLKHLAQTNHLSLKDNSAENSKIIILNDAFGSLACSLSTFQVTSWGDSHLAHSALLHNAQANQLASTPQCLASTSELSDEYDIALIKIPKTLALLEQQLIQLKTHLHTNSLVIAAGMTKYMQRSHFALFERYLGPTSTSLAVKKARLIFPTLKQQTPPTPCPYPSQYYDNDVGLTLCNHANVFSRENLDIGARFMIQQFNQLPTMSSSPLRIVDLGCGNGVLGIMAKKQLEQVDKNRGKQVYFIDESYMAIASAKENIHRTFGQATDCEFFISDSFTQAPLSNIDLILCNPPFHQSHTLGTHIATQMFKHSKKVLTQGGQLWVICNRHLNYAAALKRLFGNCRTVSSNKKFLVLASSLR